MHGETDSLEAPNKDKMQPQRDASPKNTKVMCGELEGETSSCEAKVYIGARKWEGFDLTKPSTEEL